MHERITGADPVDAELAVTARVHARNITVAKARPSTQRNVHHVEALPGFPKKRQVVDQALE